MAYSKNKSALNLSLNVITLRKKRKLTQSALAHLAGLTRASIALIESGSSNPTLEIMTKLSLALQTSLDELISSAWVECRHTKAKDIPLDRRSRSGALIRKLLPDKLKATEIDEICLSAGAAITGSPHIEGTKEYFTCIEGAISIAVLGQIYHLEKGDVLAFPGDKPHSYKNITTTKAKGISVVFFNPES